MSPENQEKLSTTFIETVRTCGVEIVEDKAISFNSEEIPQYHAQKYKDCNRALSEKLEYLKAAVLAMTIGHNTFLEDAAAPVLDGLEKLLQCRRSVIPKTSVAEPRLWTQPTLLRPTPMPWNGKLYLGTIGAATNLPWLSKPKYKKRTNK